MSEIRTGIAKKRRVVARGLSAETVAEQIRSCNLNGVVLGTGVWLAVNEAAKKILYDSAVGIQEGGENAAKETARKLTGQFPNEDDLCSILLSLHEAAYYKIAWGAMSIVDEERRVLTDQEFWRFCVTGSPGFVHRYVAYHHLKSKGWYVRSGIIYGADFVLYNRHPTQVHAEFCVLVVPLDGGQMEESLKWKDIQAMHRLCSQISKGLVMCYIEEPPNLDHTNLTCLSSFRVEERVVGRWNLESARNK